MNSFGLNSSALNAGVANFVLGAALMSAGGSLAATATRTTYVEPVAIATTLNIQADGLRTAKASVEPVVIKLDAFADAVIPVSASAKANLVAQFSATYNDAYSPAKLTATAAATKIQGAAANAPSTLSVTVGAVRSAMLESTGRASLAVFADASVKRAGKTTFEHDAWPAPVTSTVRFTADGVRTALAQAVGTGSLDVAVGEATKIHGASAAMLSTLSIYAVPASDVAHAAMSSRFTGVASHINAAKASATSTLSVSATARAGIPARVAPVATTFDFSASARLAERGAADLRINFGTLAICRLAEQGKATAASTFATEAAPWTYRACSAQGDLAGFATAQATRICLAAATSTTTIRLTAAAIANPSTPAPASRSMRVQAESRLMRIPFENRTMRAT